jgi:MarR family transcriptional regulator, organic hydroperoxide resistance regulator
LGHEGNIVFVWKFTRVPKAPRPDDDFDADAYQLSESYIPFLINRAAIAQLAFSAQTFEKFGITVPKWRVISRLGSYGNMRVGDIAKLTSIEGPTLSRFLSELKRDGLIKRKPLAADSRVNSIALTRAGKDLFDRLMPYHDSVQQMSIDGLSPGEVATLRRALKRVYFNTVAASNQQNEAERAESG